jgi:hypothetical protein
MGVALTPELSADDTFSDEAACALVASAVVELELRVNVLAAEPCVTEAEVEVDVWFADDAATAP